MSNECSKARKDIFTTFNIQETASDKSPFSRLLSELIYLKLKRYGWRKLTMETACSCANATKCDITNTSLSANNWKKILCKLYIYLHYIKLFALPLQICFSEAWTCTFQILKNFFPYNVTLRTLDLSRMQQLITPN